MSVKSTQSYLTLYEQGEYLSFLKELVYSGVKFEVLNPESLNTKWAEVDFVTPRVAQTTYLQKLDQVLATNKPKGLFAAFIDDRQSVSLDDIKVLQDQDLKLNLCKTVDQLYDYDNLKVVLTKVQVLVKENPSKEIIIGKNLLTYKDQLDNFGLQVIEEFRKNHVDQDIDQSIPEIDYISLGDFDALIFDPENLSYIVDFKNSALGEFEISQSSIFIKKIETELKNKSDSLTSTGYNPEKLSAEKYKQLCVLYSDFELENILINSEKLVFSVGSEASKKKPLYSFISVHPDYIDSFEKLVAKYKLATEKVTWDKEIVVWQQSENLNPFKAVAESLGTISSKQTDPSFIISIFFSLFFAFCLGDAIYGMVLSVFCGYFLFFKKLKPQFQNIFRLFFISGVATVVFGALLNSWAGDLFVKTPVGPLLESLQLINPLDPTANVPVNKFLLEIGLSPIVAMLGLSIVIGLINILTGYIIKAMNEFRAGRMFSLVGELNWIAFIVFLIAWIVLAGVGSGLAVVALALIGLATLGFFIFNDGKSIVQKVLGGLGKIYSLISFGADVLSFTRLVAVGLTGGIIASVINLLGDLIFESIPVPGLNILGLAIVLIIGHTFNLVISLFGAYINPLRLHYVEFLPKFYDAEGERLVSLKTDFKYLKLV